MARMKVAKAVVEVLRQQGVPFVTGIPGGGTMEYLDALYDTPDLPYVLVRHEQVGAHMALGYAQVTGRPAVALVSRGGGASNVVGGVSAAFNDCSPLVVISTQVSTRAIGRAGSQEIDLVSVFRPITKWSVEALRADRVPEMIEEAFRIATTGRPGPVHVSIPADFGGVEIDYEPRNVKAFVPPARLPADQKAIERAAEILLNAERPAVIAGGGVTRAGAAAETLELIERLTAPAITTWLKKTLPESHPLVVGNSGGGGSTAACAALAEADVVLALGTKAGEVPTDDYRMQFRDDVKVIQIDIDPATIGRVLPLEVGIQADLKAALGQLLPIIRVKRPERFGRPYRLQAIKGLWDAWQRELDTVNYDATPISSPRVIRDLRTVLPSDAILTLDAGNFGYWTSRYFITEIPNGLVFPSAFAVMGCAFPAAMGVKFACPDREVVAVAGDGSFIMTMGDLETARRQKLKVTVVVLNNGGLANIKVRQQVSFGGRLIGCEFDGPDFALVARAFNCYGERVEDPSEIQPALRRALADPRPAVLDVIVDPTEICRGTVEHWWQPQPVAAGVRT